MDSFDQIQPQATVNWRILICI